MATLLTGAGYIGTALLRRLAVKTTAGRPGRLVVLDNLYATPAEALHAALPAGAELIEGNVANASDVARAFDRLGPGAREAIVFHLAAQPSAAIAARDPELTERSNLTGARLVLEAAREHGARVVFGGSFRVYGDDLAGLVVDEDTPYGRVGDLSHLSKVYVEQLARMIGLPFVSVRLGITYGLSPVMKTTPAFMTVPNLFCQRAARGEVLQVLEDRPMAFIHVEDAVDALLGAATWPHGVSGGSQPFAVLNAATEVATIGQVARTVQRLAEARGGRVHIEGAASEATFQVRSRLQLQPRHTLQTGLAPVLDYFSCAAGARR